MRLSARLGAAAAALALAAQPAAAQGGRGVAGAFDFYVLALSWSPTYCATAGERADPRQCGGGGPRGFVVHGLWPQYERGYPSDCRVTGRSPTRAQVDAMLDVMPSPGLVRHEWRKHGTCSGLDPRGYFDAVRAAAEAVTVPQELRGPERETEASPAEIEQAFLAANPRLRPSMMAVGCRDGMMQEVRICMTKNLAFRPCAEVDRRGCRAPRLSVPAARWP